jgi:hypothetical protein
MRIAIDLNGVLRDTITKFTQIYEKYLIESENNTFSVQTYNVDLSGNTESIDLEEDNFVYEILSEVTSLELDKHFSFKNKDELFSFMYEEYTMELFGHSPSTEMTTFNILNDIYYNLRDKYDLLIVSDEIVKSKPATLFFLAKFGCLLEKVLFFSEITKENMWNEVDILVTSNPDLILNKPEGKVVIKYNTEYNKNINCDFEISTLSEFNVLLEKIPGSYVQNF